MGYCVVSYVDLLWVFVWGIVLNFMGYFVESDGDFYGLLWGSGGNMLRVLVWGVVVTYYVLLFGDWW